MEVRTASNAGNEAGDGDRFCSGVFRQDTGLSRRE